MAAVTLATRLLDAGISEDSLQAEASEDMDATASSRRLEDVLQDLQELAEDLQRRHGPTTAAAIVIM